ELLDEFGFTARIREGDDALVLHPAEWVEDGTVRVERIDDTDRAVEVPLSDAGDEDDYDAVAQHNADLVRAVEAEHGPVHAANARAFADYMSNHYVRRMEEATEDELREFLAEYYPRNAWPSAEQKSAVESSLAHLFDAAGTEVPGPVRRD
ncbi:rnhA operon protein, partial [Halobium palmae]